MGKSLEEEFVELAKNIQNIAGATIEYLPDTNDLKRIGKGILKRTNPIINICDSYAEYKKSGEIKKGVARFVANTASGAITAIIVVSGTTTAQPELVVMAFVIGDISQKVIEDFANCCLTFLDTHILTPMQETIYNFLIRTFIEPVVHQIMQWTPNPLAPFSPFGYNTSDDISFVYAYAVFKDSHYKHNAYSHGTPTYAYNTYTQERVNALSQGFSSLASDVSTHNIVISDSDISHCFDTLLYRELESLYKDYMAYTPIALDNGYKIGNIKASYLQRIPQEDIESLTPNSPLHLLKALFFCEDYILLDSNKEPLLRESNWREFYNYKSDFYTIFIADKQTLTQDYLNKRKSLYKAIMQIRKEQQEKEMQELQRQQQELEQQLQGLDSRERESKLQELQREQERKQREKERQEQRQARFSKNLNTSTTQNLTINNNAYITKDSYLVLESNDKNTKIIFLDSLKHTYTHSKAYANNYPDNTPISFSNLILQYNNQVTIFAKDNSIIDSKQIEQDFDIDVSNMSCDVYFYSLLLRGGKEDRDNPRFFYGEKGEVYMSDESDNIEVFYNDARLSMTNYYYHAYS
ncbi:hypothetical protein [Helicobacter sp. TUL]|uniref:hypothetical protein n=1 Tax=Helicobacter sp. TUL TaxID=1848928 RepID=UPI0021507A21|nr:hypothetical protein [Helicobacter sp. TUL]